MTCDVTVVIPVYNRPDLVRRVVASVARQKWQPVRLLIVDDGCTDGAIRGVEAEVLATGGNLGFAAAVNRGIKSSRTKWIALVNSDVDLHEDWLGELVTHAEMKGAWFASGRILRTNEPAVIDGTWDLIARSGCAWRAGSGALDGPSFRIEQDVGMVPATAALYRSELFERVGLFDEALESYLEDVDLGLRCAGAGLRGLYVPTAVCLHEGQGSTGPWNARVVRLMARNQVILVRKHFGGLGWTWPAVAGQLLWGLIALRHGRSGAWLAGKVEGCRATVARLPAPAALALAVAESEAEIERTSKNLYWRLYFAFTLSEAK